MNKNKDMCKTTNVSRRQREKLERHETILDAAEQVFFRKGFDQTTMDEIARAAQLSRALLYVYFRDKNAIMRGVMLRAATSLRARFENAVATCASGEQQIEGIGHAYYAFSVEEPDYFDVLTNVTTFPEPEAPDDQLVAMNHCREAINGSMVRALENGIRDGSLSAGQIPDPLQTAFFLQGALHGVIMQTHGPKSEFSAYPDPRQLIQYTISMLTAAISAH